MPDKTRQPASIAAEEYARRNPNYEKTDVELYNAFMAGVAWRGQPSPPLNAQKPERDWKAISAAIKTYLDGYELEGEGSSFYTPNSHERLILDDAIAGLLADDDFMALMTPPVTA